MDNIRPTSAVAYINVLKDAINDIWVNFAEDASLDSLSYSQGGYGAMQHEELRDILRLLNALKSNVDYLYESCRDISEDDQ